VVITELKRLWREGKSLTRCVADGIGATAGIGPAFISFIFAHIFGGS
jgi:hypothetical protein